MRIENKQQLKDELKRYIKAEIKGLFLYTLEPELTKKIIVDVWKEYRDNCVIFHYDIDNGLDLLTNFKPFKILKSNEEIKEDLKNIKYAINELISYQNENKSEKFFVVIFEDITKMLEYDENFRRAFYNGINELSSNGVYYYIVSTNSSVPDSIEKKVFYIDVPLPTADEITEIINDAIEKIKIEVIGESIKEKAVSALQGMTEEEIRNVINLVVANDKIDDESVRMIGSLKRQIIKKGGVLDFVITEENLQSVGGFERLKEWLKKKKKVIDEIEKAKQYGVDVPKGIMLFGMPGCGKSLSAKAIARYLGIPLLRLDMGLILGQYLGQSEENLRKAIKLSESVSPCVLWIDEIEKALSGAGGNSGSSSSDVITRIFGTLLTWMQEKTKMVFVIGTANKIKGIPPEFLRKGRFDEIFYVDFPNANERKEIIEIHLKKRKKEGWKEVLDIDDIVKQTDGYTGADLEALVSLIVEDCFFNNRDRPSRDVVKELLSSFKPLKESMKDEVKEIEEAIKKYGFINVSKETQRR